MRVAIISEKLGHYESASSTLMADEAVRRGYKVFEFESQHISHNEGKLIARALSYPQGKKVVKDLAKDFDVILFRPNPPVDMDYLTTLFLLKTIGGKVLIVNRPDAVITLPEKIFPLYRYKNSPATLVTKDLDAALAFLKKHKTVIVKPLYDFGGNGITKTNSVNVLSKLVTSSPTALVIQKFMPQVEREGDKRLMFIAGKFYGAAGRMPQKGSFLANAAQGGEVVKATLNAAEKKLATEIGKLLKEHDIMLAGVDVVCGRVTEINITSPTGFGWLEELYNINLKKIFWDELCKRLKTFKKKN